MPKTIRDIIESHTKMDFENVITELEDFFIPGRTWKNGEIQVTELLSATKGGFAIQVEEGLHIGLDARYIHKEGADA